MAWNAGQSLKGQRGAQVLYGQGAPAASVGLPGDSYIDAQNGRLYGVKDASTGWPTTYASLVGPQGSTFSSGSVAPGPQYAGNVGDLYFQTGAAVFFQMTSTGWQSLGSVNGTNGTNGSQITYTNAPPGATYGAVGDFAYYPTTQTFYSKTSTGWLQLGSVTGAPGTAGAAGTNGLSILSGSGSPSSSLGVTGQPAYVDTTAGALYAAKTSSGWPSAPLSLVGAPGAAGTVPNDLTPNSVAIAPVSGDSTAVSLSLSNSSSKLFTVDASGNTSVGGTLKATGASTLAAVSATSAQTSGNQTIGGTLSVTGSSTLAAVSAGAITCTSLTNTGSGGVTGTFSAAALALTLPSSGAATYPILLKTNAGATLVSVDTSGNLVAANVSGVNISASGTLSVSGSTTLSAVTAGTITGTSLTTSAAVTAGGALSAASLAVTLPSSGAATLPILLKSNAGGTLLSADTSGNVIAANVSGANISASGTLSVTGASTTAAVTSSGTVTAKSLTLTSGGGGALTFADGTSLSSAPSGSGTASTAYRCDVRGYYWASAAAANTAYSIYIPIIINTGTASYGAIPLRETMLSAGYLSGLSVSCPGGVTASTATFNVLKNGTVLYTASGILTCNSGSTPSDAYVKPATLGTSYAFAAGDVLTMTVSFTSGTNAAVQATMYYTQTS